MNSELKILAVIPARAGSKRLPGKNKRVLGGKPLVVWSIEIVLDLPNICDVIVSTDDPEIAEIAKWAGATVPWLRPEELSSDTASSSEVALHALDWYESRYGAVDGLLLLQPTTPFRKRERLLEAIALFSKNQDFPVISVCKTHAHPLWTFKMEDSFCIPFFDHHALSSRSQDLLPAFIPNGSIYLCSSILLKQTRKIIHDRNTALVMDSGKESVDIDSELDFYMAEYLVTVRG